jgi:hypothetical protein
MPAMPQSQAYPPSHSRRVWFSEVHPVSAQKTHWMTLASDIMDQRADENGDQRKPARGTSAL